MNIPNDNQVPLWVTILLLSLVALGKFYDKIKSSIELYIANRNKSKAEKLSGLDLEKQELIRKLKEANQRAMNCEIEKNNIRHELSKLKTQNRIIIPLLKDIIQSVPTLSYLKETVQSLSIDDDANT